MEPQVAPTLTEPLLEGVPVGPDGDTQAQVLPVIRIVGGEDEKAAAALRGASLAVCVALLAKAILGAGMAALPRAFALLGLLTAGASLLFIAWLTHFSLEALALGSLATGRMSYPEVVHCLLGRWGSVLLGLSLVLRCAGLMTVYIIVSADILAGSGEGGLKGLLCDLLGGSGEGWCSSRPLAAAAVTVAMLAPLVSARRLTSTAYASWVGLAAVLAWAGATLVLVGAAVRRGEAHAVPLLPDFAGLSGGGGGVAAVLPLLAVIPIIATAYTCQMTVHFVMREMQGFNQMRMSLTSLIAVGICTVMFLTVAVGSLVVFGPKVPADVLQGFNAAQLKPLLGPVAARACYTLVRLAFLLSVLAIFPMQMWPYVESFERLCFGRELGWAPSLLLKYASLALFYCVAMVSGSIWRPLQLVGATAGALIAFIFPGLVAIKAAACGRVPSAASAPGYWRVNGHALLVVGALQAVAGVGAALLNGSDQH